MGRNRKKRLCIYVIYDSENIIDDYIGYMLQEIRNVGTFVVVVCNFTYILKGMPNLEKYADRIIFRENIGYDAGAYKDTICQYLGWDQLYEYDELVLINDSFYGPFCPMGQIFEKMEQTRADYWGLTRSPAGVFEDGKRFPSHIQSYFLCVGRGVLHNAEFQRFWEELLYPQTLSCAIACFELGLNRLLDLLGFRGAAWMDFAPLSDLRENENPYLIYPLELICNSHVPVLKRKSLELGNQGFSKALKALEYIDKETVYDIALIRNHLLRISQSIANQGMISFPDLEAFYKTHAKIYFYGAGVYGRNLAILFAYLGWSFAGFLVSDADRREKECFLFDETVIEPEDGIILTVGKKEVFWEMIKKIGNRCEKGQLLFPNYILEKNDKDVEHI